jgi:hypothetical protein
MSGREVRLQLYSLVNGDERERATCDGGACPFGGRMITVVWRDGQFYRHEVTDEFVASQVAALRADRPRP